MERGSDLPDIVRLGGCTGIGYDGATRLARTCPQPGETMHVPDEAG